MKIPAILLMFFGYVLIYAAVAAGGKFAVDPWAGLFADAYTESTDPTDKTQGTPDSTPPSKRVGRGLGRIGQGIPRTNPRPPSRSRVGTGIGGIGRGLGA